VLLDRFPSSAVIQSLAAELARRDGDFQKSTAFYEKALKSASHIHQFQLTIQYHLSHNYFLQLDYERAIPFIVQYLAESHSKSFKAYGSYKLGFCYWMTLRKDMIADLYSKVESLVVPSMAYDTYALRKVKQYFANGNQFTPFDEIYIPASGLLEGKMLEPALRHLQRAAALVGDLDAIETVSTADDAAVPASASAIDLKGAGSKEEKALYLYLKGAILKELSCFNKASLCLRSAHALGPALQEETWVTPHADVLLCEIKIHFADWDKAAAYLQRSKTFTKFDFEKQLTIKAAKLGDKIKKKKQ